MNKIYKNFFNKAKEIYSGETSGHDISHIKRCLNFAKLIQKIEGGNIFVLTIATIFHDVHRVMSNKQCKFVPPEESIPYVKSILEEFNLNEKDLKDILYLIEQHDNKHISKNIPLELKILQDADILDALGKIGLNRTLTYCKNKNIPIFNKNYSLDCEEYIPNIFPISTTHYVYRTMIPQLKLLKTETGKKLAKKQVKPLQNFVNTNIKKYDLLISKIS